MEHELLVPARCWLSPSHPALQTEPVFESSCTRACFCRVCSRQELPSSPPGRKRRQPDGDQPRADSTTEKSILLLPPAPCSSSHEIGPAPGLSTQGTSPTASQKTGHTPGWEGPRGFKTKPRYRQTAWHPHQALLEGCFTTLGWFLTSFRDQRTAPCPELSQQGTRQRVTRCQDSSRRGRQEESPPLLP